MLKVLLERGESTDGHKKGALSPLHVASFHGRAGAAQLLVEKGADLDVKNQYGETPLDIAMKSVHCARTPRAAPPRLRPARRRLPPRAPQGSPETEDLLRKADERRRRESFGGSSDGHVAEVEDCARAIDLPVDPMMVSSDGASESDDWNEAAAPAAEAAATDSVDRSAECASEAPVPTSAAVLPPTGVTPTPRARGLLFLFARCCFHDDD